MLTQDALVPVWAELDRQHLTLDDIAPILQQVSTLPHVTAAIIGHSYEGRPIHQLKIGHGALKILAWTQMHGDEPTASAAILDLLQHLVSGRVMPIEEFLTQFTLLVIPMLNPDGAARRIRINAQGIDINRDALKLTSPEGRLLMSVAKQFKPDVAFNLHDQNPYYSAGRSRKPSTIAFLAPAYDEAKSINPVRARAMQLIAAIHAELKTTIPNQIARYDDTHSVRSFGDTLAGLGASTILIESGAQYNDPNRQTARHMNIVAICHAIRILFNGQWQNHSQADYFAIPENLEEGFADILIRDITLNSTGQHQPYIADVTFRVSEKTALPLLDAIGDLSHHAAFQEINGKNIALQSGNGFALQNPLKLTREKYRELLLAGYSYFVGEHHWIDNTSQWPMLCKASAEHALQPGCDGYVLLVENGKVRAAILGNCYISNLRE
ncbi:M14 family zinc carboxypeptidase [Alteromonas flava]|uniref:M14 family zinc carboxypeptidase n=1 Tax=Alteromonas flava TaxID=2048003 RepID=UPI000C281872|nr:M14 family zinc carboxypeptidase [Alteromonas flava]